MGYTQNDWLNWDDYDMITIGLFEYHSFRQTDIWAINTIIVNRNEQSSVVPNLIFQQPNDPALTDILLTRTWHHPKLVQKANSPVLKQCPNFFGKTIDVPLQLVHW
jgi:hypothetical protein